MKSTFLLVVILLLTTSSTKAQDLKPGDIDSLLKYFYKKPGKRNNIADGRLFKDHYVPDSFKSTPGSDHGKKIAGNIPNAYSKQMELAYAGNNNKGFSIYTSGIDNMIILKPDSSFFSFMPILREKTF